jgi:hypothetical protein
MEVVSSCVSQNSGNGILVYTQCNASVTITDTAEVPLTALGLRCSNKVIATGYISSGFVPDNGAAVTLYTTQKAYSPVDGCCVQNVNINYNVDFDSFLIKLAAACGSGTVEDPYRIFTQGSEPQSPCQSCP